MLIRVSNSGTLATLSCPFLLRSLTSSATRQAKSASSSSSSSSPSSSSGSSTDSRRPRSRFIKENDGPKLTFEHFLLRSKSIKLYRDFLRASRNIPNPEARRETVDWLRDEHFEGPTGLKAEFDIPRIRELLMGGNVALKRICGPMELAAALNPQHGSFPKLRGGRSV